MALKAGARLGPYEILGLLGAGGMGEVYRARDTKLKRDVGLRRGQGQFAQQRGASPMGVFTLEAFDLVGDLRRNHAVLSAVPAQLGNQCIGATVATPHRPFQ
jgi:serine/threonine protein kinase